MTRLKHNKNSIEIGGNFIKFNDKVVIRIAEQFGDKTILVLQGDYPPENKCYNNVIALSSLTGIVMWEIEIDDELDFRNPYEGVVDNGSYFIFFKAKGERVAVNKNNGKLLRNIDLMTGNRPW